MLGCGKHGGRGQAGRYSLSILTRRRAVSGKPAGRQSEKPSCVLLLCPFRPYPARRHTGLLGRAQSCFSNQKC